MEFLQKLSEWLQKRLAGLPKAERASIQDDIDKITAAIARMDQQATPNANTTTATTNPTTTPEDATKAATETTSESGNAKVGGDKVSSKAGTLTIVRLNGGRLASVRESELAGNGDTLREFDPATLKPVKGDKGAIARTDIDLQASATTPVAATSETLHKVPVTIRLRDGNIRTADFEQLATS
ncbi:MAG: hypothetical protein IPL18_14680, partial [Sphingomonadales bacterium]|nr:hypothetical protein [Sphingomonadales bacterium]